MAKPTPAYQQVLDLHKRRLEKVSGGKNLAAVKAVYDRAQAELIQKLKKVTPSDKPFTFNYLSLYMAQIRAGQIEVARRMIPALDKITLNAMEEALDGTIEDLNRMAKSFSRHAPLIRLEEALRYEGIIDPARSSLLVMHKRSMARYGSSVIGKMQRDLAKGMVAGDSTDQTIARIQSRAALEWYQAERITRTETAFGYNSVNQSTIEELAPEVPGLYSRWVEHVSDATLQPLDDRVGIDSIALHGQVVKPGGLFTMPDEPGLPRSLRGLSWSHPPNRPNDRSVVTSWMPGWGGYAYELRNGKRHVISKG